MPRLTPDEIEALLSRPGLVRLATVDESGAPLVVPPGLSILGPLAGVDSRPGRLLQAVYAAL